MVESGAMDKMFDCCSSGDDGVMATAKSMEAKLLFTTLTARLEFCPILIAPRLIFLSIGFTTST